MESVQLISLRQEVKPSAVKLLLLLLLDLCVFVCALVCQKSHRQTQTCK